MENTQTKGTVIEPDFYVAQDTEGKTHWYKADPLTVEDRSRVEVDINQVVADYAGGATVANPSMVRLFIANIDRSIPFAISQPNDIRTGNLRRHFEDQAGHVVEILQHPGSDPKFPVMGVLFDHNGNMCGNALYSLTGECSDGVEDHRLICVKGEAMEPTKNVEVSERKSISINKVIEAMIASKRKKKRIDIIID